MSYTHLSAEERMKLYQLKQQHLSNRTIARHLGRSASTISRELQRNQTAAGIYLPDSAQGKMQQRRQAAKTTFGSITKDCITEVKLRLEHYHSPEQIAGRLKREGKPTVSHETIYQMVYQDYEGMGEYARYLRQFHIRRQKRGAKQGKRGGFPIELALNNDHALRRKKHRLGTGRETQSLEGIIWEPLLPTWTKPPSFWWLV